MIMRFKLVDSGWDRVFDEALAADHSELRIICPFIKERVAGRLVGAGRPRLIHVITRFNLSDFYNGVSDTGALRLLLKHGAHVRGIRNLHAKVYLFGGRRAVVTSANLTEAALSRNEEFGFVAEEAGIIACCRKYFDEFWQRGGPDLTKARLERWEARLSSILAGGSRPSETARLPDEGVDAGVTVPSVVLPPWVAEAPQAFVKFFGTSRNRANRSLPVIEEVKIAGCHWACTYPKDKRPRQVGDGAIIFVARLVKEPNDIIIFGRAVAMKYQEGRDDATEADKKRRDFKERFPHYIRVHHAEFVSGGMENGISLKKLMDELDSNAFASTQKHAARGRGSTDPHKAYMRQPAVKLSDRGYGWLNDRLEAAFRNHGKLTPSELGKLDWPERIVKRRSGGSRRG